MLVVGGTRCQDLILTRRRLTRPRPAIIPTIYSSAGLGPTGFRPSQGSCSCGIFPPFHASLARISPNNSIAFLVRIYPKANLSPLILGAFPLTGVGLQQFPRIGSF